ncbi:MAG: trehalose-6-phosphate synthase [Bryobacteraceae bacterium]|nr:trehalose-6-phosphate synthase [Bryobacteraceae bacterium]
MLWNRNRLQHLAKASLGGRKLIVVSCRSPYSFEKRDGHLVPTTPAGGLTAALKPVMEVTGGVWIAQSSDQHPSPRIDLSGFSLRTLLIPNELSKGHYEGLSNRALWPLCHNAYYRPEFRPSDWEAYRRVNEIFAEAVLQEAGGEPATVFVQDYHFALLPRLLKAANPALTVGQFWHIPFPHPEIAQLFPWLPELLDGMLGNDLLGFHVPSHSRNFQESVQHSLAAYVEQAHDTIWYRSSPTQLRAVPVSIDFQQHSQLAASTQTERYMREWAARLGPASFIGLGIDRLDYTKGIPDRIRALSALFEANPALRGKLTFVQVGVPSRTALVPYAELGRETDAEVQAINHKWGTDRWTPVLFEKRSLGPCEMMALHRLSRFCMVTPLHDGMNLVAKEFVASRADLDGVLILSRFAGAAQELGAALLVNPFNPSELSSAILTALAMERPERRARMAAARAVVRENNVFRWAGALLQELAAIASLPASGAYQGYPMTLSAGVA